jgi:hypothetical protein
MRCYTHVSNGPGEVAERFKAAVLKTVVRKHRGFESLPLRLARSMFASPNYIRPYRLSSEDATA